MNHVVGGLNTGAVRTWLQQHDFTGARTPQFRALAGGQSNPTFRVTTDRGEYVLRKKPPGTLRPSAHAIDREYRVMQALAGSGVPVPRMLAWCDDVAVTGTPFFLMEFLQRRVFPTPDLPLWDPVERGAIYQEMNRVIASLRALPPEAFGLGDFGRRDNYVSRQLARWMDQCASSALALPPAMHELMAWLPQHVPQDARSCVVHGDFRIDNLVFHPHEPRVIGVLDWELSTLGDPLADLSYHCMAWRVAPQVWRGMHGLDLRSLGIPREEDYVARYEASTGFAVRHWNFYMAYNLFRMAAILHGIAQRAADGNSAAADAVEVGAKVRPLAELAWAISQDRSAH